MTDKIRILIVDDHPVVRDGLRSVLGTQADFEVVGEAGTGEGAIEEVRRLTPDIILLDLEMPGLDGIDTISELGEMQLPVRVIVFTAFDTDERIVSALKAGARGYLLKGVPRDELFHAIRVVHSGGSLLQPIVASKFLEKFANGSETLTARELEVLRLLAEGLKNKEMAERLFISERTIKFHVSAILGKLGASNRTEAVRLAIQRGLISF